MNVYVCVSLSLLYVEEFWERLHWQIILNRSVRVGVLRSRTRTRSRRGGGIWGGNRWAIPDPVVLFSEVAIGLLDIIAHVRVHLYVHVYVLVFACTHLGWWIMQIEIECSKSLKSVHTFTTSATESNTPGIAHDAAALIFVIINTHTRCFIWFSE